MQALLADPMLVCGGRVVPQWLEEGRSLAFIDEAGADAPVLVIVDCGNGSIRLRRGLGAQGLSGPCELRQQGQVLLLRAGAQWHRLDPITGAVQAPDACAKAHAASAQPRLVHNSYPTTLQHEFEVLSPDGTQFLSLCGHDAALRRAGSDDLRMLTSGATRDRRWSTQNAAWSPCGRRLALVHIDEREVDRVPLTDWSRTPAPEPRWEPYARVGRPLPQHRLHVIDPDSGEQRAVPGHDADTYTWNLGFSPDGRELRYARMDRRSRWVEVSAFNPASGEIRRLLREESSTFLYWSAQFFFSGPPIRFLENGGFLWLSEATGWRQLYLYDASGTRLSALTQFSFPVTDVAAVDETTRTVWFRAQPDAARPYDIHLYCVSLDGGTPRRLSSSSGQHELQLAPNGACYLDHHSAPDRPPSTELRNRGGKLLATLASADISGLAQLGWRAPEQTLALAADGRTPLNCVIFTPYDFDPKRKYPVIDYLYAGPQTIHAPGAFPEVTPKGRQAAAYAQMGYVVVMLDARGTPGRSKAFQDHAWRRLGDYEIADHVAALKQLAGTRPWMDIDRVGVTGGSFGGYFTVRALIQAPEFYRSGVACTPAELGPHIFGPPVECYTGFPEDEVELFARLPNTDKLGALRGELLLIACGDDVNTPISQTHGLASALRDTGKHVDQLLLPGLNHLYTDAAGVNHQALAHEEVMRHFLRTLPPHQP